MGGGGGGNHPTWSSFGAQTDTTPWGAQQPYLEQTFRTAGELSSTPMRYFPGQAIAGFTPEQEAAMGGITRRATDGSPLIGTAQRETEATIRGDYLSPDKNPWLRGTYERALESTMPAVRSSAVAAGRTGSLADITARNDLQARLANEIYGGNYARERGFQQGAVDRAIPLADYDYSDLGRLYGVGAQRQTMSQAEIDEARKKWEFGEMEPWMRAANFKNLISGDYGGTTTASGATAGMGYQGGK